jgi:hypothetical protein
MTLVVRGGRDTPDKLRGHVSGTAHAWSMDGQPLLGISVFALLGEPLDDLLRRRFAAFARSTCPPRAGWLSGDSSFWPLRSARASPCVFATPTTRSFVRLLAAFGAAHRDVRERVLRVRVARGRTSGAVDGRVAKRTSRVTRAALAARLQLPLAL